MPRAWATSAWCSLPVLARPHRRRAPQGDGVRPLGRVAELRTSGQRRSRARGGWGCYLSDSPERVDELCPERTQHVGDVIGVWVRHRRLTCEARGGIAVVIRLERPEEPVPDRER